MRAFTRAPRRGMSVAELLIGMVILAIVGMALTRTLQHAGPLLRSPENVEPCAQRVARSAQSRDLRPANGRSARRCHLREPRLTFAFAFPMRWESCAGPDQVEIPLTSACFPLTRRCIRRPVTPAMRGAAATASTGTRKTIKRRTSAHSTSAIRQRSERSPHRGARVIKISAVLPDTASYGTPVFLYRRIRYSFGPSSLVTGRHRAVPQAARRRL